MMKVLVFVFMILSASVAKRLISSDEIETLFKKALKNELSDDESRTLQEVFEILHRPERASTRSFEDSTETRMTLDCVICRSAFAALFDSVRGGETDADLTQVISVICVSLGIENHNVCHGAVGLNMPILTHIIRTTPEATPAAFCGLVMQSAHDPNICPFNDPRFEWQVQLPEPPSAVPNIVERSQEPLTIAVLTDAHIDPLYEAFGVGACDEPTCCRKGQTPARSYIYKSNIDESIVEESVVKVNGEVMLDLDVVPKIREMRSSRQTRFASPRNAEPAGFWGDYRSCDTPIWAYDDVIDRISETHKDVDVVYYIGDTIDHGVWETTFDLINDMNLYLVEKIRKNFGDDVLVVPVLGNHESQPTNQKNEEQGLKERIRRDVTAEKMATLENATVILLLFPGFAPSTVTGKELNTTWLYEALEHKWTFYLPEGAKSSLLERGEFSVLVRPGLRAISLNNNVAYKYNWWLVYDPLDAKKHLDWLVDELYKAEQAGEKVHILAHIPPGVHDLTQTWTREYNRIVNRFSSTIAAEFNGHTHSDEFKIFYSPEGTPINVAWGGGSATAYSNYNLNYKIATFDTETFLPESIVNFVYNLTEANLTPNRRPHWFQLYDMKNTFILDDLSAVSMDNLVNRMVTSNRQLLDIYSAFFSKLSDTRWPWCNNDCKLDNLCKTVVTVLWERQKCNELTELFHARN